MKILALVLAGFFMELLWAAGVVALHRHRVMMAVLVTASAPYVALVSSALTVVDEPAWGDRMACTTWYSAGAVAGLLLVLWLNKKQLETEDGRRAIFGRSGRNQGDAPEEVC